MGGCNEVGTLQLRVRSGGPYRAYIKYGKYALKRVISRMLAAACMDLLLDSAYIEEVDWNNKYG